MQPAHPARPVAHTPRLGSDEWGYLDDHLIEVAGLTQYFAGSFGWADLGVLVGLWHDLGKFNPTWQEYLWNAYLSSLPGQSQRRLSKTPHAVWGAVFAYKAAQRAGLSRWHEFALAIQGHHSRLADGGTAEQAYQDFLMKNPDALNLMGSQLRDVAAKLPEKLPVVTLADAPGVDRDLLIRMVFSALIDADRLASEKHGDPEGHAARDQWPDIASLWRTLAAYQEGARDESTLLNRIRNEVYDACCKAAEGSPGLYRLTVPTGAGKTRSGLAFALKHAVNHGLRRVVVALPYTSIIDQTVRVYRDILGDDAVLEHHSAFEPAETDEEDDAVLRTRLATENWEATLIVTTTVQLFESLLGNTTSKVRKLHRLARSVIVLDEVQALPPELLVPTVQVLRQLTTPVESGGYGATVVLCTATQPSFDTEALGQIIGDARIAEIVPSFANHFAMLRRVRYDWRRDSLTWEQVVSEVRQLPQVMVVLNTRKDALAVLDAMGEDEHVFHLSALLCGAHRRAVLNNVRELLASKQPVRLISTQVVECGVDLDFPVVYRALGPLDRVVQAAGRCNRNFRETEGKVVVFEPAEGSAPRGPYRIGIEKARLLMDRREAEELHDPELYRTYFRQLFSDVEADRDSPGRKVQDAREVLNFPEVARHYRMIPDEMVPVIVPYGSEWRERLDEWRDKPSRRSWQRLQPYLVNLYARDVEKHRDWLEEEGTGLYRWWGGYDSIRHRGIVAGFADPSDLIV